jgi:hypothetical protein
VIRRYIAALLDKSGRKGKVGLEIFREPPGGEEADLLREQFAEHLGVSREQLEKGIENGP